MVTPTLVRVDPKNRCAAVLLFAHQLLVLPFVSASAGVHHRPLLGLSRTGTSSSDEHGAGLAPTGALLPTVLVPKKLEDEEKFNVFKYAVRMPSTIVVVVCCLLFVVCCCCCCCDCSSGCGCGWRRLKGGGGGGGDCLAVEAVGLIPLCCGVGLLADRTSLN